MSDDVPANALMDCIVYPTGDLINTASLSMYVTLKATSTSYPYAEYAPRCAFQQQGALLPAYRLLSSCSLADSRDLGVQDML